MSGRERNMKVLCSANQEVYPVPTPSKCATGMFECKTAHTCINDTLMCNGAFDCEDGSDEDSTCDRLQDKYYEMMYKKRPDAEFDRVDPNCG
ncbi:hypothetical protein ACOMHN_006851 [Nucella lapillus]